MQPQKESQVSQVLKMGEKLSLGEELGSMVDDPVPEACVSHV